MKTIASRNHLAAATLLALGAAATALPVAAAEGGTGFYLGADAGVGKAEIKKSDVDQLALAAFDSVGVTVLEGASELSRQDFSLGAIIGYRFLPFLAAELSYLDLGESTYRAEGLVTDGQSTLPVVLNLKYRSGGPALSALGIWPVHRSWDVYARAGLLFANTKSDVRVSALGESAAGGVSKNTQEFFWGLGTGYEVDPHYTVRLDFQEYLDVGDRRETGEANVNRLTLAILYRF